MNCINTERLIARLKEIEPVINSMKLEMESCSLTWDGYLNIYLSPRDKEPPNLFQKYEIQLILSSEYNEGFLTEMVSQAMYEGDKEKFSKLNGDSKTHHNNKKIAQP